MAYDESLSKRIRRLLKKNSGIEGKKMFGGIGFLLNGNMAYGILGRNLIVRLGPQEYENVLALPHTRVFDITGRTMKGWVMVGEKGLESENDLSAWVNRGVTFARALPKK